VSINRSRPRLADAGSWPLSVGANLQLLHRACAGIWQMSGWMASAAPAEVLMEGMDQSARWSDWGLRERRMLMSSPRYQDTKTSRPPRLQRRPRQISWMIACSENPTAIQRRKEPNCKQTEHRSCLKVSGNGSAIALQHSIPASCSLFCCQRLPPTSSTTLPRLTVLSQTAKARKRCHSVCMQESNYGGRTDPLSILNS